MMDYSKTMDLHAKLAARMAARDGVQRVIDCAQLGLKTMTLCLIPARSGSKRLPGKNWLEVGGKTLVQRAVDCALGAGLKPYIVTDAPERCAYVGAVVMKLPAELAGDDVPMRDVVAGARAAMRDSTSPVILLQPTSPLRSPSDVMGCLHVHRMNGAQCDVVSVTARNREAQPRTVHRQMGNALHSVTVEQQVTDVSHVYERNGAVYIMRGNEIAGWTQLYVMPPERSVDIDTAEDLEEARRLAGS